MFVSEALGMNEKGHLTVGGCDCVDLAYQYGTPLYVLDEGTIRKNCRSYRNAMESCYGSGGIALYASKALSCKAICRIAQEEGLGLDVVSGGELYTAHIIGFPMDRIYFHGNNKTRDEIRMGLELGVGRFVVDNWEELQILNQIAGEMGSKARTAFRIKPGIDAHTHDFVKTGQIDSKFGFALENGEAADIIGKAFQMPNIDIQGVHCHIGSQIFDIAPFELAARVMLGFMAEVKTRYGLEINELNLGGGFGIRYIPEHDPLAYDLYIKAVSKVVSGECKRLDLKIPYIVMEPGRSIVASAGITLYTVGSVKNIKNVRTYVSVDGGMTDNPRYALYGSRYEAFAADRPAAKRTSLVTIAGRCCESGDILIKDIQMPPLKAGDLLAVAATGAYNYSMSSNYNRVPRPPVILIRDGNSAVIIKREDYADITRNDCDYPF